MQSKTFNLKSNDFEISETRHDFFWSSKKVTLTGLGEAQRIQVQPLNQLQPQSQIFDEIETINLTNKDYLPAEGPCAFAAFPFDPTLHAEIIIPRILLGEHASGDQWVTYTSEDDLSYEAIMNEIQEDFTKRSESPITQISVEAPIKPEQWRDEKIPAIKEIINTGSVKKVVLARELILTANKDLPIDAILENLKERNKTSLVFSIDGFIGASPELLVSRFGNSVRANPLAGTATRYNEEKADLKSKQELLNSTKDAYEHKVTIEWILREMLPFCSFIDADPEPRVVSLPHVHHLGTKVNGQLSQPAASILELVAALHPTPAVAGDPQREALNLIRRIEGIDRQRYAGPVGWVDSGGNGEFAVGIRSAEVVANKAHIFAGVGLVADSEPQSELNETRSKFQTMLSTFLDI